MKKIALVKDKTELWKIYKPVLQQHSEVILLDIFKYDDYIRLLTEKWDAFFWRAKHDPKIRTLAKRLIYLFNKEIGIKTFPSWSSYWHYDDKIAQHQIFKKFNIPIPDTFVFFNKEDALSFIKTSNFPMVYKASSGAGSANVGLLKNKLAARIYIKKAFGKGIKTFFKEDLQRGYVYFQEFLKNNSGDYRIVCYGDEYISGFFRNNRTNKTFASGSGKFKFNSLPLDLLKFTYNVHKKLGSKPVMSYDILKDNNNNWVVTEISVIFGDLSIIDVYKKAKKYKIENGNFLECEIDLEKYLIERLLENWGWVE